MSRVRRVKAVAPAQDGALFLRLGLPAARRPWWVLLECGHTRLLRGAKAPRPRTCFAVCERCPGAPT